MSIKTVAPRVFTKPIVMSKIINGRVFDAATNIPVAEVFVRGECCINNEIVNISDYTDVDGNFIMSDLPRGKWTIYIEKSGYELCTITIDNQYSTEDIGTVLITPVSCLVIGSWVDMPEWVQKARPTGKISTYVDGCLVAILYADIDKQGFKLPIPEGVSVSIEVEIRGYKMSGSIVVNSSDALGGKIYKNFSFKSDFLPIYRDVRIVISGMNVKTTDFVGAYCEQTGLQWSQTQIIDAINTSKLIELGTRQVPAGYILDFKVYLLDDRRVGNSSVMINSDSKDTQIIMIQMS